MIKQWIAKLKDFFSKDPKRELAKLPVGKCKEKLSKDKSTRDSASEALDRMFRKN